MNQGINMWSNERSILGIMLGSMIFLSMMILPIAVVTTFTVEAAPPLVGTTGKWTIETVDSTGDVGMFTSIALDSANKAHISYYDYSNHNLKYATNAGGYWYTTTVDSTGDVGMYSSLALDSSNKAHISYYDAKNFDLKYATNAGGSWKTTTVDSTGDVGLGTSIALDSANKVHISYYDYSNTALKYATNAGGSWKTTTVDSTGDVGGDTSIALDSANKVHISYMDLQNYYLKYATNAGGSWNTTTVDSTGDVGWYTSIALDSSNKAHISYFDQSNFDLKYATEFSDPSAPTDLMAKAGDSYVQLSWGMPSYPGPGTPVYHLFRDGALLWSGTSLSYNDTSVVNEVTYIYTVAAQNDAGLVQNSSGVIATPTSGPTPPGVPVGLHVSTGDGHVTLTWDAPSQSGSSAITGYKVYRGTSSGSLALIANVTGTTYGDVGLTNGQTYHYKVSAASSAGESIPTEEVVVTPAATGIGSGGGMTLIILIVAVVAIAGVGAGLLYLRRKK